MLYYFVKNSQMKLMEKPRCDWGSSDQRMISYHDNEWGTPVHNDQLHFEYLVLDAFQAGLSWSTILNKRENFRKAFDNFDYQKISKYETKKITDLLLDSGIIRNRLKIEATINNAKRFLEMINEFGSFDKFIWTFVDHKTVINKWNSIKHIPALSKESDKMSKELKKRGFKFVGSTICYAYMQAAGLVNDHTIHCFRFKEIQKTG
jgi:DNA-3-methyladenine glycosylase I